jgi:MoxR-like ATPase
MGVYLGRIDIKRTYYNFTPLYELSNDKIRELHDLDYERIIPESEKRNINFSYNPYSQEDEDFMDDNFYEDVPVVFSFELNDLEINLDRAGYINQTGYKIRTFEEFKKGNILPVASQNCYLLLDETDVVGDPRRSNILELGTTGITDATKVMIKLSKENVLIGPYEVSYRTVDQTYIVSTKPEENRYVLSGYKPNSCEYIPLLLDDREFLYVRPNTGEPKTYVDIITDKNLIEAFKTVIREDLLLDGKLDLSNTDAAVEAFGKSAFMIEDAAIRRNRLQRITELLKISDDVEDSIKYISETLGQDLGTLISKYDDKEDSESFFNRLLALNPEILNRIPDYSYTKGKIEELKEEASRLQDDLDNYQKKIEHAKQLSTIDQDALKDKEALEEEITSAKKEKEILEEELKTLEEKHSRYRKSEELEESVAELQKKNDYLEMRKTQLSRETSELSSRLADVSTNIEKKISEMPIDGLVANMLVEASSSWKSNMEKERLLSIVGKYNEIGIVEKSPEEMVEYMYQRVKEVRPLYDKNTVTNICTCIFQNFLTVFSGDPGCGKTSICNIMAQALGLEKIGQVISRDAARYIPVSVERGWTSKRDFIGYYNPLTKSFDKNNKRIFEALQIADLEEENALSIFPMIILLDEANLSPMEYYWADFMNICDDLSASNEINIGENTVLSIPETLHFVATINNDHTTETLSPRLIDRAAVITLPKVSLREMSLSSNTGTIDSNNIEIVPWSTIKNTYIKGSGSNISFPVVARKTYDEVIKPHLRKQDLYVSPRTELAVTRYCDVSSKLFDRSHDSARRDPAIIALDYAIAQKILPKINGYGEEYREWLDELMKKCEDNYLIRAKEIINDIITKGDANMSYYQFFA